MSTTELIAKVRSRKWTTDYEEGVAELERLTAEKVKRKNLIAGMRRNLTLRARTLDATETVIAERDALRANLALYKGLYEQRNKEHAETLAEAVKVEEDRNRLQAALEEVEQEASGALNNSFPEDAPFVVASLQAKTAKALKSCPAPSAAMWSVSSAVAVIASISPAAYDCGYNLHLGGGVLDRGYSAKDLDVLAMPRFQAEQDKSGYIQWLTSNGWASAGVKELPHRQVHRLEQSGQVIDLIFVEHRS